MYQLSLEMCLVISLLTLTSTVWLLVVRFAKTGMKLQSYLEYIQFYFVFNLLKWQSLVLKHCTQPRAETVNWKEYLMEEFTAFKNWKTSTYTSTTVLGQSCTELKIINSHT